MTDPSILTAANRAVELHNTIYGTDCGRIPYIQFDALSMRYFGSIASELLASEEENARLRSALFSIGCGPDLRTKEEALQSHFEIARDALNL